MEPPLSVVVTMPVSREPSEERGGHHPAQTMPAAEALPPDRGQRMYDCA
ncbi:hypothetical protein LN650_22345 [Klebsiella pneumoniae subsp. pneumoniae]|nr:hypothetical protein [Klebsiella pneumoniae subsp. pneumoniae]